MNIKKKKFAVVGNPIEHSLSPIIHSANFKALQLKDFTYKKILVEDIRDIRNIALQNELCGFNVTLPWKEKIIPMLDEIHLPNGIQAVNTVVVDLEKKYFIGYNTDIYGILRDFEEKNIDLNNKRILVLGYGGLGKAIVEVLKQSGPVEISKNLHEIITKNLHAATVVSANRSYKDGVDIVADACSMLKMTSDFDIVINTTSIHSFDGIDLAGCMNSAFSGIFYDCTPTSTEIVDFVNANTAGKAHDGKGMLVHQATKSFELWTGKKADVVAMKGALNI